MCDINLYSREELIELEENEKIRVEETEDVEEQMKGLNDERDEAEENMEKHKQEINDMTDLIGKFNEEGKRSGEETKILEKEKWKLESDLQKLKKDENSLLKQKEAKSIEIRDKDQLIGLEDKQIEDLTNKINKLGGEIQSKERELQIIEDELQKRLGESEISLKDIEQLQLGIDLANQYNKDKEEDIKNQQATIKETKADIKSTETEVEAIEDKREDGEDEKAELESEKIPLEQSRSQKNSESASLESQISIHLEHINNSKKQLEEDSRARTSFFWGGYRRNDWTSKNLLINSIAYSEKAKKDLEDKLGEVREKSQSLNEKLKQLDLKIMTKIRRISGLDLKLQKKREFLQRLNHQLKKDVKELTDYKAEKFTIKKYVDCEMKKMKSMQMNKETLDKMILQANSEIKEKNAKLTGFNNDLKQSTSRRECAELQKEALLLEKDKLCSDSNKLQKTITELNETCKFVGEKINTFNGNKVERTSKINILRTQIEDKKRSVESHRNNMKELSKSLHSIDDKRMSLENIKKIRKNHKIEIGVKRKHYELS